MDAPPSTRAGRSPYAFVMGPRMNDGTAFQKRRQLLDMLDKGLVMIHLDPRPEEVIVPAWLKTEPVLRLNLAYGFRLPALDVGADGIYAVLSFNRQNFGCTIPWGAVFALTMPDNGHDGMLWPTSLPDELKPAGEVVETGAVALKPVVRPSAVSPAPVASADATPAGDPLTPEGAAPVRDVPTELASQQDSPGAPPTVVQDSAPRRSHLRLVKG